MGSRHVTVLAGGFGGSKLAHGMALAAAAGRDGTGRAEADAVELELTIVVNTGDDLEMHGLSVSPDLDTVTYTLAGLANTVTGWGVRDETWNASAMLERFGAPTWFRLGDRDLGTHIGRTKLLRDGRRLTDVTAAISGALGITARLLPMTDDRVRTKIRTDDTWLDFQDWFVKRHHADAALEVRFDGIEAARPTPEVLSAMADADLIVFAPSNPFVSIGTILAVPGMVDAVLAARAPVVAVSPIVGGTAVRGPAAQMMESLLGGVASAAGVARHYVDRYPGAMDAMVIDQLDAAAAPEIEALGLGVLVAQTVMDTDADRAALAQAILAAF